MSRGAGFLRALLPLVLVALCPGLEMLVVLTEHAKGDSRLAVTLSIVLSVGAVGLN